VGVVEGLRSLGIADESMFLFCFFVFLFYGLFYLTSIKPHWLIYLLVVCQRKNVNKIFKKQFSKIISKIFEIYNITKD